jgi:hypothetical protein
MSSTYRSLEIQQETLLFDRWMTEDKLKEAEGPEVYNHRLKLKQIQEDLDLVARALLNYN